MKSALSLALLAATTLAVVASPASAARGGHAGPGLPRRRHHARMAAVQPSSTTDVAPPPPAAIEATSTPNVVSVIDEEPSYELEARAPRKKAKYPVPAGWSYAGCVLDASQRLLSGLEYSSGDMTVQKCLSSCQDQGFTYGGVEWSNQCFCGNELKAYAGVRLGGIIGELACNQKCSDGSPCGGWWSISLFKTNNVAPPSSDPSAMSSAAAVPSSTSVSQDTTSAPPSTTSTAAAASWPSQGCVTDSFDRSLKGYSEWTDAGWTAASCTALCQSRGFSVAGIEVKTQCYCSNQIDASNVRVVDNAECDWTCEGTNDRCGGGWRLSIYSNKALAAIVGSSSGNNAPVSTSSTSASAVGQATSVSASAPSASASADPTPASTAASSPTTAPSSGGAKAVYAHMMVGNTYPFTYDSWMNNIRLASAAGFDGFALNVGHEDWQARQVAVAYQAAAASGTGFKMFLSLDMTSLACSAGWHADALKAYVTSYAGHSAQAYYQGRQLVSTFAGTDCTFGMGDWNSGWEGAFKQPLKAGGNDIFFLPSIFTDPSTFGASALDGELNWNSGWPSGGGDLDFSSDERYLSALGGKAYMAAIAPAFYTHYGASSWNKNWQFRSDNWLYSYRWEQLIANRNRFDLVEALTWNDYGESSYIGPIDGAQPNSQSWVDGFDHTALGQINAYYSAAFKTGSYPTITQDKVFLMARPHPAMANANADSVGPPTGREHSQDNFYALIFATAPSSVTLTSGAGSQSFSVNAGVTRLQYALAPGGGMSAKITRNGADVVSLSPNFTFNGNPAIYNFNSHIMASS